MKNKKVVVTGGAGFIGSNIAITLSRDNRVIVIDDLSTGNFENIKKNVENGTIEHIKTSITDLQKLQEIFKEDIDFVFHEAAIPSVQRSINDPAQSNFVNVNGTLNVLIAARDNGVKKVVYASSSSVYGDTPTLPKKEDVIPCPLSPYAVSKLTGEYYCQIFTKIYDMPTISLRYFNVYGPRQDPLGEYAAVIPKFITHVLENKNPVIYGDGEQTRDFTFIDDVVDANSIAAESTSTGIFNVASSKNISINKLANLILTSLGKEIEIFHSKPQPGDIKHSLADISKAVNNLGYQPKNSIEEGLIKTEAWFQGITR